MASNSAKHGKPKVSFLTLILSHYRVSVHEQIRLQLNSQGIDYEIVYSDPVGEDAEKRDTGNLSWGKKIALSNFSIAGKRLPLQWAFKSVQSSDLVIVSQENRLLMNYYLIARSMLTRKKMAFFGHGRGYQSKNTNGLLEKWKRFLARRANWWFAYTQGVADYLVSIGYPEERITVVCNSIDTTELRNQISKAGPSDIAEFKQRMGIKGKRVGLYIGGMYSEKRIPFLCESAIEIRKAIPDFELLLGGGGSAYAVAKKYADKHEFIHAPGPLFDEDRAIALKMSDVFLMPGLVGLAVIDSFIGECPIVTTDYPFHSPEFEYLQSGKNGIVVRDDGFAITYSKAVADLLKSPEKLKRLRKGCISSSKLYTAQNMAKNLADGMQKAINHEKLVSKTVERELNQLASNS